MNIPDSLRVVVALLLATLPVRAAGAPSCIVSLSPALTDLVADLGAADRLCGIGRFSLAPAGTRPVPIVGDLLRWDFERIVSLRPDWTPVQASGALRRQTDHLRSLGVPVEVFRAESVEEFAATARAIAVRLGAPAPPTDTPRHPPGSRSAVLLISADPLFASGDETYEGDLLRRAGFRNAVRVPPPIRRVRLSPERLLHLDPDVIFVTTHGTSEPVLPAPLSLLRAVREGRVHAVDSDLVLRPGLRAPAAIRELRSRAGS